jgi:hypothetical protein
MILVSMFWPGWSVTPSFDARAFDAAVALAQSLTQWGFLIIAGSVVMLVGTSYYRPAHSYVRKSYLLFLLSWILMGISIFKGIQVQMANVARLFRSNPDLFEIRRVMTHDANCQICCMELSLGVFGIWLLSFSIWWIFHKEPPAQAVSSAAVPGP